MKPTIGRIVNYVASDTDKGKMEAARKLNGGCNEANVLPAIVTAVWSDTCVNLRVIADGNLDIWVTSANQGLNPGQWSWPERQE